MKKQERLLTGERLRRLCVGVTLTFVLCLMFALGAVSGDAETVYACPTILAIVLIARWKGRKNNEENLLRQIWDETAGQNAGKPSAALRIQAEENWKREKKADCLRLALESLVAALLCALLMAWAVQHAGGKGALQTAAKLGLALHPAEPCYTLAKLGLLVLTPLHAVLIGIGWWRSGHTEPDFSAFLRDKGRTSAADYSTTARPLPVMVLEGEADSASNRTLLAGIIRAQRRRSLWRIAVWILVALLAFFSIFGLFRSGVLAVICLVELMCVLGILLPSLATAYSLRQSIRILQGLDAKALRFTRDRLLRKEKRSFRSNLDPDEKTATRSVYCAAVLEKAGTYAVGRGKSYLFAADLQTAELLPEKGPVQLVYVPGLEQPYMLVIQKEGEPA